MGFLLPNRWPPAGGPLISLSRLAQPELAVGKRIFANAQG